MERRIIQINSIDTYNKLYGFETVHPLVTVADMSKAKHRPDHVTLNYGVYALFLKHGAGCTLRYGREAYDYQEGTIVSLAPGQVVTIDAIPTDINPDTRVLLFHPDMLYGTQWAKKMGDFTFFDYDQKESLHLSEREQQVIISLLDGIADEIEHPVDQHSQELIMDHIGLVLDYCLRFYDRQFITRRKHDRGILENFQMQLKAYFKDGTAEEKGLPTVGYFADKACLSPGYFGDLFKKETGISAQRYIQNHVIELAKQYLLQGDRNISEVAYRLGFKYPQHFTRLFKQQTGLTPYQYREGSANFIDNKE